MSTRVDGAWEARLREASAGGPTCIAALRELRVLVDEHAARSGVRQRFVAVCIPGDEHGQRPAHWYVKDRDDREPDQHVVDAKAALRLERALNEANAR